jgi:uncharacterized alpha-E superfamily protein
MSRYLERAENVARFIGVTLHLHLDRPLERAQQWQPLIDATGDTSEFGKRYGGATQENVISFMTLDPTNPNSIYSCVRSARENARSVRETISSEMWEQVNRMYLRMQSVYLQMQSKAAAPADTGWLPELLREIRMACHLFHGITDTTMSHNEAWHFVNLGGQLERAEKIARILDVKYFMVLPSIELIGTPYDDLHWSAILKSVSGFEMYRKIYGRISPRDIVEFLILDRDFPRAIHHCISGADVSLHAITGIPVGSFSRCSGQLLGLLRAELDFMSVDSLIQDGLHEYLEGLQVKIDEIGNSVSGEFFSWRRQGQASAAASNT